MTPKAASPETTRTGPLAPMSRGGVHDRYPPASAKATAWTNHQPSGTRSLSGVMREILRDGFERLAQLFERVKPTDDPVADLALLGREYRYNALTSRHVFEVMFGGSNLAGFTLTAEDRQQGRYTLMPVTECTQRCMTAARFRPGDAALA